MAELLPRFRQSQLKQADERKIGKIILEAGCSSEEAEIRAGIRLVRRSADGHDPARLRGLPAVGRNVTGATRHTDPVQALLWKESRRTRRQ